MVLCSWFVVSCSCLRRVFVLVRACILSEVEIWCRAVSGMPCGGYYSYRKNSCLKVRRPRTVRTVPRVPTPFHGHPLWPFLLGRLQQKSVALQSWSLPPETVKQREWTKLRTRYLDLPRLQVRQLVIGSTDLGKTVLSTVQCSAVQYIPARRRGPHHWSRHIAVYWMNGVEVS